MTLDLLFYESEIDPPTPLAAIEEAVASQPGISFSAPQDDYCGFSWCDPATGARCEGDIGRPPMIEDEIEPPRAYDGWRPVELSLHLPIAVPHWHCVEAINLSERLIAALPGLALLNTEDTARAEDETGPGPVLRAHLLATWERLHAAQVQGLADLPRMDRQASLALWRYRRERAAAAKDHPDLVWHQALVLCDDDRARSAAFWDNANVAWPLPPVELLILSRPDGHGVLPADELVTAAGDAAILPAAALRIEPTPAVRDLHRRARLLPAARFQALTDEAWTD